MGGFSTQLMAQSFGAIHEKAWKIELQLRAQLEREDGFVVNPEDPESSARYSRKLDSLRHTSVEFQDTTGSQQLFEHAFSPPLQRAVQSLVQAGKMLNRTRIRVVVFEHNGEHYVVMFPLSNTSFESNGYLLYQNKTLLMISYCTREIADWIMKTEELRVFPYNWFLPIGSGMAISFDDRPSSEDYYRIVGRDSLEYIGRVDSETNKKITKNPVLDNLRKAWWNDVQ